MYVGILSSVPSLVLGIIIVGGAVALAAGGMLVVRSSVTLETLEAHQEVAGFIIAIVGVVYAVLLALVVIAVWEQFGEARAVAEQEANQLAGLYRLTSALPGKDGDRLRGTIREYAESVVSDEWPAMQRGQASQRSWELFDDLWRQIIPLEPQTARESGAYQEALSRLDGLGAARRARLLASRDSLPPILWSVLIAGAVTTIGFTYFFGVRRLAAQLMMTIALTTMIALALFLIYAMDLPFSGDVSVKPEALQQVLETFDRLSTH